MLSLFTEVMYYDCFHKTKKTHRYNTVGAVSTYASRVFVFTHKPLYKMTISRIPFLCQFSNYTKIATKIIDRAYLPGKEGKMTSLQMRNDPLFMRNSFKVTGKWDIPIIKNQDISLDNVCLILSLN